MPSQEYLANGIITLLDLSDSQMIPPADRLKKRFPIAMFECIQSIPCNACYVACKPGALTMKNVNDTPLVDFDKCNGCLACLKVCPGLAIFLLQLKEGKGQITLQYEFLAVPAAGEEVWVFDRAGRRLTKGKVVRVFPREKNDGTALLTVEVPEEVLLEARAVAVNLYEQEDCLPLRGRD